MQMARKLTRWEYLRYFVLRRLPSILLPLIASLAAGLTLMSITFMFSPTPDRTTEADKLFQYLSRGIEQGTFDADYFRTGFNHFDRKSDGKLARQGTVEVLEDFVVFLNSNKTTQRTNDIAPALQLLTDARKTEPFSALPAEERRLMDHLQVLVDKQSDKEAVSNTMNELKQVILARHKEHQRIQEQNQWSIPLSIIGASLTLVFGIWTTVLTIKRSKMTVKEAEQSLAADAEGVAAEG